MKEHMKLLGLPVRDLVTGFAGIVTTVSFDLYGCVQAVVTPFADDKGQLGDGRWFDTKRLVATSADPVMALPAFDHVPGGDTKPAYRTDPTR